MRSLSSIFSSDTLAASLRPTAAVVFALVICVAFRLVLGWLGPGFTGLFGYWLVDTDMGFARVQMDRESVDGKPRCLVIGSSRVGLGIHTPTLADDLGWQVIKTPVSAGTPWTFLYMFEAEPHLLDGVDVMVVDVEYFQFNDNSSNKEDLRYHRLIGPKGLGKSLWPIDGERRDLIEVVKGVALHATGGAPYRPMHERWKIYDQDGRKDPGMLPERAARRVAQNFVFSESMVDTWGQLVALCDERGIDLIVIYPPVQAAFVEQLDTWDEWRANRERVLAAIAVLDQLPAVTVIYTELVADAGLTDEDAVLMDYGHLTGKGACAYTSWLSKEIQTRLASRTGSVGSATSGD